jgi:hypothetical protein
LKEEELLNKIYALFIDERGLTEDFQQFMAKEAIEIFFSTEEQSTIN